MSYYSSASTIKHFRFIISRKWTDFCYKPESLQSSDTYTSLDKLATCIQKSYIMNPYIMNLHITNPYFIHSKCFYSTCPLTGQGYPSRDQGRAKGQPFLRAKALFTDRQGSYSQHFIFFGTYKWAQQNSTYQTPMQENNCLKLPQISN